MLREFQSGGTCASRRFSAAVRESLRDLVALKSMWDSAHPQHAKDLSREQLQNIAFIRTANDLCSPVNPESAATCEVWS
jgi:hypothetical protein